jgi:hypothetical protein
VQPLVVPVNFTSRTILEEVTIDYSQRWIKDHWGAFYSAYGKAPFYEYFADGFKRIWDLKPKYLLDLNIQFMTEMFKLLTFSIEIRTSSGSPVSYTEDYRNVIEAKHSFDSRKVYQPKVYTQLFGDTFVPNLSVVDVILNTGPEAGKIVQDSLQN